MIDDWRQRAAARAQRAADYAIDRAADRVFERMVQRYDDEGQLVTLIDEGTAVLRWVSGTW